MRLLRVCMMKTFDKTNCQKYAKHGRLFGLRFLVLFDFSSFSFGSCMTIISDREASLRHIPSDDIRGAIRKILAFAHHISCL